MVQTVQTQTFERWSGGNMNAAVREGSEGPEIPANGAGLTGAAN